MSKPYNSGSIQTFNQSRKCSHNSHSSRQAVSPIVLLRLGCLIPRRWAAGLIHFGPLTNTVRELVDQLTRAISTKVRLALGREAAVKRLSPRCRAWLSLNEDQPRSKCQVRCSNRCSHRSWHSWWPQLGIACPPGRWLQIEVTRNTNT